MNVGILGLGLIGGSLARAYAMEGHQVCAWDQDASVLSFAKLAGAVHETLDTQTIGSCQLILLAVYPGGSTAWLERSAAYLSSQTLVVDCCGMKEEICRKGFSLARQYGFTFVGGHPMAGSQFSGFRYSRADLFRGAPMVLVPPVFDDISLLQRVQEALRPCHFGSFSVTTAQNHDRMIAFTSQMPHLLSNAFIKSPTAQAHKGFSAGSYKDLTRVAWLNPQMWAELFLENRENLLFELDTYLDNLNAYREALAAGDQERLVSLLEEGKRCKEEVDG